MGTPKQTRSGNSKTKEGGNAVPRRDGEEQGTSSTTEEAPPHRRHRTTEEEEQAKTSVEVVAIDKKTLLMLVKTVRELKEGVSKGQESRGGSSPHTRSPGLSADEAMMEDEDLD